MAPLALQQATLHQEENFEPGSKNSAKKLVHGLADHDYYVNAEGRSSSICLEPYHRMSKMMSLLMRPRFLLEFPVSTGSALKIRWYSATSVFMSLEALYGEDSSRLKESLRISFQNSIP